MTDGALSLVVAAVAAAAAAPLRLPAHAVWIVGGGLVALVGAWVARRGHPVAVIVLAVGLAMVAGGRSTQTWAQLSQPLPARFEGTGRVVTDPAPLGSSLRLVIATQLGRLDALLAPDTMGAARSLGVGDSVRVEGAPAPWSGSTSRRAALHLAGRLQVDRITRLAGPAAPWRLANQVRLAIAAGAGSLASDEGALYTGLVYGDDREQSPEHRADFAAAGLTHLLAVSGQNVAFVLLLARPGLLRLGYRGRWVATVAVLGLFGAVTRFEPSVLRAVTMAAVAASADLLGREVRPRRALLVAVLLMLLYDPLLVHSIGFRLSVAATAGIITLAAPLSERLRGPQPVRVALATTLAAQVAVGPLLASQFAPVPLGAIPANLLAAPLAGFVMVWGMSVGVVAGAIGGTAGSILVLPVRAALVALAAVAQLFAGLRLGQLGVLTTLVSLLAVAALVLGPEPVARLGRGVVAFVVGLALLAGVPLVGGVHHLGVGGQAWIDPTGVVVVIDGRAEPGSILIALRQLGVRRVDLVLAETESSRVAAVVGVLRRRLRVGEVRAPPEARIPGSRTFGEEILGVGPWLVCRDRGGEPVVTARWDRGEPVACSA